MTVWVGLDLGQANDWTAISVVDVGGPPDAVKRQAQGLEVKPIYRVRTLVRAALGTPYPVIVKQVNDWLAKLKPRSPSLVIDATGVGRPVVDMFDAYGVHSMAVTITGGDHTNQDGRHIRVPKKDLVGTCTKLFQTERLRIQESLPLRDTFVRELNSFRMKQSAAGHISYDAREGEHDDLVLSVGLAVWAAERDCNDSWHTDPLDPSLSHGDRALLLGRRADERVRRRKLQAQRDPDGVMGELEQLD